MEKIFIEPSLVRYGNANKVIKGQCGFGGELPWLDKVGTIKTTRKKWVEVNRVTLIVGPWYVTKQCKSVSACSHQSDQC